MTPTDNDNRTSLQDDLQPRHAKAPVKKKKGSIVVLSIVLAILLCIVAGGIGYLVWQQDQIRKASAEAENTPLPEVADPAPQEADPRVQNPIDFPSLKLENSDIYAWIYIPNTKVNYPILQSASDDFYYLTHNQDKEESVEGALYTEMANATDFSDPVTVVYGHNIQGDLMFSSLHYFENEEFFNENDTLYVYTMGHILTYKIIAAYQYDDRHILNSFDFTNPVVRQSYFDSVLNPESLLKNTRSDTTLGVDDKIIQLSTCMTNYSHTNTRYLVTGVLVDDQPTY